MTKEEIEKVWSWIDNHFHDSEIDDKYGDSVNIVSSDTMVFKDDLYQDFHKDFKVIEPSLPSSLDEAAEEYRQRENDLGGLCDEDGYIYESAINDAFKAGAKWMAKQQQGHTAEVGYWNQGALSIRLDDVTLERLGFHDGDIAIVQIIKDC